MVFNATFKKNSGVSWRLILSILWFFPYPKNCIRGVMASGLAPSAIDLIFETRLSQTKDYTNDIFAPPLSIRQ